MPKVIYRWSQGSDPVLPPPKPQLTALVWKPETLGLQTSLRPKAKAPSAEGPSQPHLLRTPGAQPHTDFSGSSPGLTTAVNTPVGVLQMEPERQSNSPKLPELKLGQTETAC